MFNPVNFLGFNAHAYTQSVQDPEEKNRRIQDRATALRNRQERQKDAVHQFCHSILQQAKNEGKTVEIPFRGIQRKYFLEWFFTNELEREDASLIAASFDSYDWDWLRDRLSPFEQNVFLPPKPYCISALAMRWMTNIAKRLRFSEFPQKGGQPGLWLFFFRASSVLEFEQAEIEEEYRGFFSALTIEAIFHFSSALAENLQNRIVTDLMEERPLELISWVEMILKIPREGLFEGRYCEGPSVKVCELFSLLDKNNKLHVAINLLIDTRSDDAPFLLNIYSALSQDHRRAFLEHLFQDKYIGMNTLFQWIALCVQQREKLKPYAPDFFAVDLYLLLHEIHKDFAKEIKMRLLQSSALLESQESREYLDLILPDNLNVVDTKVRQRLAIRKLSKHLQTPGISHKERAGFILLLIKDLKGSDKNSDWLSMLFSDLPRNTWALLFVHFLDDISRCVVNLPEESSSPSRGWFSDRESWVRLAVEVFTLIEDIRGPQTDIAMKNLYRAMEESQISFPVIQRLIQLVTPGRFVSLMNTLAESCFYNNLPSFCNLVSTSMENAKVAKRSFILQCLLEGHKTKESCSLPMISNSREKIYLI